MGEQTCTDPDRTPGHDSAFMAAIDQPTDGIRHQAIGQQSQAKPQGGFGAAETQLALDRAHDQREGVKNTAPSNELWPRQPYRKRAECGGLIADLGGVPIGTISAHGSIISAPQRAVCIARLLRCGPCRCWHFGPNQQWFWQFLKRGASCDHSIRNGMQLA